MTRKKRHIYFLIVLLIVHYVVFFTVPLSIEGYQESIEEADNEDINGEYVEEMGEYMGKRGEQVTKDRDKNNGEAVEGPISLGELNSIITCHS